MEAYQYGIKKQQEEIEKENINFDPCEISLKNSKVELISLDAARDIILKYEWLKSMPLFNKYFFGIYFYVGDRYLLGGVVIYSEEYSSNKATTWNKYDFTNKIILLSRGVCLWWTPRNTASYFISKTIYWIKKNTNYKIITATVDPAAGEIGTIYQSLNWHYIGLMSGNYGKTGKERSSDTKLKISETKKINGFSEKQKELICKKVYKMDLNDNLVKTYESTSEASKHENVNQSSISRWCKNNKKAKDHYWSYSYTK